MRHLLLRTIAVSVLAFAIAGSIQPAQADDLDLVTMAGKGSGGGGGKPSGGTKLPKYYSWMNPEIQGAWSDGFLGQGATITVVDDFNSRIKGPGNLDGRLRFMQHGDWTLKQANMIAPSATMVKDEFTTDATVALSATNFNVINLSYGAVDPFDDYTTTWASGYAQEQSLIDYATAGSAIVVKSAGNEGVPFGTSYDDNGVQMLDYLGASLIGTQSAIIVGALEGDYSTTMASLADYSNTAGLAQNQYLMVRVDPSTGLTGTSFAAPIVSGYAAMLSSKFTTATSTQVTNQLLDTARTTTITGYDVTIHGRGEASIANALAPNTIK